MTRYQNLKDELRERPRRWLVTGAAGFIGSHVTETLLHLDQQVVGLDNFATGKLENLEAIRHSVGEEGWSRFRFQEGDIRDLESCLRAVDGVELVIHQAALGSVPRSLADPLTSHAVNVDGFLNVLQASRLAGVERISYASSSSVYGDHPDLPKQEDRIGEPLSPYAATKRVDELYAAVMHRSYGIEANGLRYFNVVGPRQDPLGPYAAVVPRWISTFLDGVAPRINGDGETSRDFCPVANVVQANLLAATTGGFEPTVFNIALGGRTTLDQLYRVLREELSRLGEGCGSLEPQYGEFRPGDVRHSQADISRAQELLGYEPEVSLEETLAETCAWFREQLLRGRAA